VIILFIINQILKSFHNPFKGFWGFVGMPKVLQPLAGKPLLAHVIDTARSLSPAAIHARLRPRW
jgi:hypothetical protein